MVCENYDLCLKSLLDAHVHALPSVKEISTSELLGKPKELVALAFRWTSIPSRGSNDTPGQFMLPQHEENTPVAH